MTRIPYTYTESTEYIFSKNWYLDSNGKPYRIVIRKSDFLVMIIDIDKQYELSHQSSSISNAKIKAKQLLKSIGVNFLDEVRNPFILK
jgi:hypothetical protein